MNMQRWRVRCPGYKHPNYGQRRAGRKTENRFEWSHTAWKTRRENEPERRYYCMSCEAWYPYLVDVGGEKPTRVTSGGVLPPQDPDDPTEYTN